MYFRHCFPSFRNLRCDFNKIEQCVPCLIDLAVRIKLVGLIDGQTVPDEFAHRLNVALRLAGQQLHVFRLLEADHLHVDAVSVLAVFCEAFDVLREKGGEECYLYFLIILLMACLTVYGISKSWREYINSCGHRFSSSFRL